eukprot:19287-Heterococcus_DN1.PRE.2
MSQRASQPQLDTDMVTNDNECCSATVSAPAKLGPKTLIKEFIRDFGPSLPDRNAQALSQRTDSVCEVNCNQLDGDEL